MKAILLLLILGTFAAADEIDQLEAAVRPIMNTFIQKNSLKHNDRCDYRVEEEREKGTKDLAATKDSLDPVSPDIRKFRNELVRIISGMANVQGNYCNAYENLQCSPNGFCMCIKEDESYGFKHSFKWDGDSCKLIDGSICISQTMFDEIRNKVPLQKNAPQHEFKCADKNGCVLRRNGNHCSKNAMMEELKRMAQTDGITTMEMTFINKKIKEGICICKGASVFASSVLVFLAAMLSFLESWFLKI